MIHRLVMAALLAPLALQLVLAVLAILPVDATNLFRFGGIPAHLALWAWPRTFWMPGAVLRCLPHRARRALARRIMRRLGGRRTISMPGAWLRGLATSVDVTGSCPACGSRCGAWQMDVGAVVHGVSACGLCTGKIERDDAAHVIHLHLADFLAEREPEAAEGPCASHDWPEEGLLARILNAMSTPAGVNVCRGCWKRAGSPSPSLARRRPAGSEN